MLSGIPVCADHKVYPQCNTDDTNTIAQPDCKIELWEE